MAKRLTDTDIWDKEWFMNLSPKLKCLVKFVRDKCDLSGVWNPNWVLAKLYIGDSVNEDELLKIDDGKQFHKLKSGKVFCVDFISFQNGKLSDKSPIHIKILAMLEKHGIPYPYPIDGVCNTPIVVVEEREGVRVVVGRAELIKNFIPPTIEEVREYFKEKGYLEKAAEKAFEYYDSAKWTDSKGTKIKNWKQKMIGVWFKDENKILSENKPVDRFAKIRHFPLETK